MIKKPKYLMWWMFAISIFLMCVCLQIPAAWLVAKFYKNNSIVHNVSGNLWHGQADWHKGHLTGSMAWKVRPLDLFLLRLGAQVELRSGQTQLNGIVGYGLGKNISLQQLNGKIAPETLKHLVNWQWPTHAIQLQDLNFDFKKGQGFSQVDGQLQWAGGELTYIYAQRQDRINIPTLKGTLSDQNHKLMFDIRDPRDQKLMALEIDQNLMSNVQFTQRFLMNIPSYKGKAGLDTYVMSSRQPLFKGGF